MPRVGLKPTIPVFECQKTVLTLDCMATVIRIKHARNEIYAVNFLHVLT
jgi:hypothetical protein